MGVRFEGEQLRLTDLMALLGWVEIHHASFMACTLLGPIHLQIGDHVDLIDIEVSESFADSLAREPIEVVVSDKRTPGAVTVRSSSFDKVTFIGVSFTLPPGHAGIEIKRTT